MRDSYDCGVLPYSSVHPIFSLCGYVPSYIRVVVLVRFSLSHVVFVGVVQDMCWLFSRGGFGKVGVLAELFKLWAPEI
jgi:hypothetical protein